MTISQDRFLKQIPCPWCTRAGWHWLGRNDCVNASVQGCHVPSLKSAMVGVFTHWKLTPAKNQGFLLSKESHLLNVYWHIPTPKLERSSSHSSGFYQGPTIYWHVIGTIEKYGAKVILNLRNQKISKI